MENLPKTLQCLFETVIKEYEHFSWASQEVNGKMKITLTWTNELESRSKSKSTLKRDYKRYEQYMKQKELEINNTKANNERITDQRTHEHTPDGEIDSETEMDIIDDNIITPHDTSLKVNKTPQVDRSINSTLDTTTNEVSYNQTGDNGSTIVNKSKQSESNNELKECNNERSENKPLSDRTQTYRRRYFRKVVIKTSSGIPTTLIGKMPGKEFLIEHCILARKSTLIDSDHRDWKTYMKNVQEDFKDVTETQWMCDKVHRAIRLMELYIFHNKLYEK